MGDIDSCTTAQNNEFFTTETDSKTLAYTYNTIFVDLVGFSKGCVTSDSLIHFFFNEIVIVVQKCRSTITSNYIYSVHYNYILKRWDVRSVFCWSGDDS